MLASRPSELAPVMLASVMLAHTRLTPAPPLENWSKVKAKQNLQRWRGRI